jgi:ABC-type nickel/cobalt efflux system permease component RcnA
VPASSIHPIDNKKDFSNNLQHKNQKLFQARGGVLFFWFKSMDENISQKTLLLQLRASHPQHNTHSRSSSCICSHRHYNDNDDIGDQQQQQQFLMSGGL